MLGGEYELEAIGDRRQIGSGFLGDRRRVVVEHHADPGVGGVSGIELFEECHELARAMAIDDSAGDVPGDQVQAGHQRDRSVSFVFVVPANGGMAPGCGWQIGCRGGDGLNLRLFVEGDESLQGRLGLIRLRAHNLHLLVDQQHLGHFLVKVAIAAFEIVGDLVRAQRLRSQDLRDRSAAQLGQTRMVSTD